MLHLKGTLNQMSTKCLYTDCIEKAIWIRHEKRGCGCQPYALTDSFCLKHALAAKRATKKWERTVKLKSTVSFWRI